MNQLKIVLLLTITMLSKQIFAQMKEYTTEWTKVEKALQKGFTKTADTAVKKIFNAAIKENNTPQIIKAAMHLVGFRTALVEESELRNHFFLDTLIAQSKAPAKNILQSLQAELLYNYFQQNRWRFYNRTEQVVEKSTDIQTWSIGKLHKTISNLFEQSLQNPSALQRIATKEFDPIILEGENTENLRPTIYDLLAFRALDYFSSTETSLPNPSYKFTIEQPEAFADAKDFVAFTFKTKDTAALHFKALKIYQELIAFHLKDKTFDALIDADILRLTFVNTHSTVTNKSKLFSNALQNIVNQYGTNPVAAQAQYLIANELISNYKNDSINKNNYSKAKTICDAIISKFPKSEGGINAFNLLQQINEKNLDFHLELVNLPNEPFRTLIIYKNIDKVYYRLIKISKEELEKLNKIEYEKQWKSLIALKPFKSVTLDLPKTNDYQQHSVEAKIDVLDIGMYVMLTSIEPDFKTSKNILAKEVFHISNISLLSNNNEYHVLNRNTGAPLANASIQTREQYYDYNTRNYVDRIGKKYTTDVNGYFKTEIVKDDNKQIKFEITYKEDKLNLQNSYYSYYNDYNEVANRADMSFLLMDRAIYRPGQTIYFKGIVIKENVKPYKATVVANKKVKVNLMDANYQKVDFVELTTNEYGSYNGAFTLPSTGLTGQFFLQDSTNNTQQYFRVEEYKRPKFSVEIKQPKGSYKINDSITVTATAKAFAGNNIDGAKVKYRVVRKVQYPIWWYNGFYRGGKSIYTPYNRGEQMEITNGETITDAKGEFKLQFKAIPDASIAKENQPTFYYELNADVTDINGETRIGTISIPVSYQALQLNIESSESLPVDSFKTITIKSTNVNGQFEPATVKVTIQQLDAPKTFIRDRYWQTPDQFLYTEPEFKKYFPLDVYKEENEKNTWKKLAEVYNQNYTTKEGEKLDTKNLKLNAGHYIIEIEGKDKYGEIVKVKQFIELTSNAPSNYFKNEIAIENDQTNLQPGDKLTYRLSTSFDNIYAIHENYFMNEKKKNDKAYLLLKNGTQWRSYEQLNSTPKNYSIDITEADRGGMATSVSFVKYNRVFATNVAFPILWSNKELNISFETFRDKTLPGSTEEYRVKITGAKGEKLAAEMLATMYDASLDQITPHQLNIPNLYPTYYNNNNWWTGNDNFKEESAQVNNTYYEQNKYYEKEYDIIGLKPIDKTKKWGTIFRKNGVEPLWWLNPLDYAYSDFKNKSENKPSDDPNRVYTTAVPMVNGEMMLEGKRVKLADSYDIDINYKLESDGKGGFIITTPDGRPRKATQEEIDKFFNKKEEPKVQVRKNFNETAFFLPDLKTDAEGNIIIKYTIPEALTEWKLMTLAHTKDLVLGSAVKKVVTQKPLMVQPNLPRFVREGDKIELAVKIVNLSDKEVTGTSQLELINPETNQPVDGWFKNLYANQYFTVAAGQSTPVVFQIEIPFNYNKPLLVRTIASSTGTTPLSPGERSGVRSSDAEENMIPVVTNRMLVTETMPLPMKGIGTKNFKLEKLIQSANSSSISHQGITIEYTSNPAWYAVQALPYLMEYPYECAEQTFNRYYANALASKVANSNPKIKAVFEQWAKSDSKELISNLSKNEALKSALLEETPWVMDAQNETQQKKNIALLFDLNKMATQLKSTIQKLKEMQSSNGGFVWFKGGRDDRYITQYILTGIGHLKKLGALDNKTGMDEIINKAIPYLDARMKEDYDNLVKAYKTEAKIPVGSCGNFQLQYLYMRSFFPEKTMNLNHEKAYLYFLNSSEKSWLQQSKYLQAMTALVLHRYGIARKSTATTIIKSLKENAIINDELGMYWKDIVVGYYWYQAPIETMSLMVEAFSEVGNNIDDVNALRTWLIKNKQTNNWKTTKATAEACYAFLLQGTDFLSNAPKVDITLGITKISFGDKKDIEAGNLYSKTRIDGEKVKPEMGNIVVNISNPNNIPPTKIATSWGGVYWQYFEELDKITPSSTPLQLKKKIFKETLTDKGKKLTAINENDVMQVGDKMIVRIELKVDRDMEYIHMKDMRSSGTEPINVLSQYKWQDGLGYYESTKDVSTNFFFNYLPKGNYVFEYPLFVSHKGNFSNGVTTIQCMYAPEFTSHSEGVRVKVE